MNKVIFMGRLTRDPEIRYSQGDTQMAIARFSLAVDRRFKRQNDTVTADFFNCTAFGKLGEFVEKYLKQGTKILLSGRIQNDNYTNKEGQKVYSTQIIAEEIEFAESKKASTDNSYKDNLGSSEPEVNESDVEGFMNIPDGIDGSLPFN